MELRDYQLEIRIALEAALDEDGSTLLVAPTGTGKTVTYADMARREIDRGRGRVMVCVNNDILVAQTARMLRSFGLHVAIEKAEQRADTHWFKAPVVLTTWQTQIAGRDGYRRMQGFDPMAFSLLVIDEAHHAVAPAYKEIIRYYDQNPNLHRLGATATPNRADERALVPGAFATVGYHLKLMKSIDDGWLVEPNNVQPVIKGYDISGCHVSQGELKPSELAQTLEDETPLYGMAAGTFKYAGDRRTLVFTLRVKQARLFSEMLNRMRANCARYISGQTPTDERTVIIADYRAGRFQYLVNVGVFTEGYDVPEIACVSICRPCLSLPTFQQMMGRGLRPVWNGSGSPATAAERLEYIRNSSKPDLLVIDPCGNFGRHNVVNTIVAMGEEFEEEDIQLATQSHWDDGQVRSVREMLKEAQALRLERYKERMEREAAEAKRRHFIQPKVTFDATWSKPLRTLNIAPPRVAGWHKGRMPSSKMISLLEKFRVEDPEKMTFTEAGAMIGELIKRRAQKLCTYRQAKVLKRFGYPASTTFEEAGRLLDKLIGKGKRK